MKPESAGVKMESDSIEDQWKADMWQRNGHIDSINPGEIFV